VNMTIAELYARVKETVPTLHRIKYNDKYVIDPASDASKKASLFGQLFTFSVDSPPVQHVAPPTAPQPTVPQAAQAAPVIASPAAAATLPFPLSQFDPATLLALYANLQQPFRRV